MKYAPLIKRLEDLPLTAGDESGLDAPDRRDGRIYHYDDALHLAVEVALATGRPLLLRGDPGTGKSSLAAYVARNLKYRYYEHTVTSQTNAQDLLWKFDLVRRLADAQARAGLSNPPPLNDYDYVEPGVLWWVFNRSLAENRGWEGVGPGPNAPAREPNEDLNKTRASDSAVVLIDELDKADPDVPNALLVPLGSLRFRVTDVNCDVKRLRPPTPDPAASSAVIKSRLLVMITTNEEKELPAAFMRRCVVHRLEHPNAEQLVRIAEMHFDLAAPLPGGGAAADAATPPEPEINKRRALAKALAVRVERLRKERRDAGRRQPGTAEFLDALRACLTLNIEVGENEAWEALERASLVKDTSA